MLNRANGCVVAVYTALTILMVTALAVAHAQTPVSTDQAVGQQVSDSNITACLFVYGSSGCKACRLLEEFLLEHYGSMTIFCDIAANKSCRVRFFELIREYGMPPEIPTTFIVGREGIVAVIVGDVENKTYWEALIHSKPESPNRIPIYGGGSRVIKYLNIEDQSEFISKYLPEVSGITGVAPSLIHAEAMSFPELLAAVSLLAISDSVNPCCIYMYLTLLIAAATYGMRTSTNLRRALAVSGIPFIAAVYAGYYLLGVGLAKTFAYLPMKLFGVAAVLFGLLIITTSRAESKVLGKEKILKLVPKAKSSALMSAVLGFLVTYAILPCSAGPYVVFTGIISRLGLGTALTWLAYYNLVFVMPLIVVFTASLKLVEVAKVRDIILRYSEQLSAAMGFVLIAIGFYVLFLY